MKKFSMVHKFKEGTDDIEHLSNGSIAQTPLCCLIVSLFLSFFFLVDSSFTLTMTALLQGYEVVVISCLSEVSLKHSKSIYAGVKRLRRAYLHFYKFLIVPK